MKSQWFEYKEEARTLRSQGVSIRTIEKRLGIPRSTLSGWFKDIKLTPSQQRILDNHRAESLKLARLKASEWHRNQKALRIQTAKTQARETLDKLEMSSELLDLAFAMLYFGEGAKANSTSIGSSDAKILLFVLAVLRKNYSIDASMVKCELHLRADQDEDEMKTYWSQTLGVPIENFRYTAHDQRTAGRKTYDHYKGVCVIYCGSIAIQRKLIYLYTLFCDKVSELNKGD